MKTRSLVTKAMALLMASAMVMGNTGMVVHASDLASGCAYACSLRSRCAVGCGADIVGTVRRAGTACCHFFSYTPVIIEPSNKKPCERLACVEHRKPAFVFILKHDTINIS